MDIARFATLTFPTPATPFGVPSVLFAAIRDTATGEARSTGGPWGNSNTAADAFAGHTAPEDAGADGFAKRIVGVMEDGAERITEAFFPFVSMLGKEVCAAVNRVVPESVPAASKVLTLAAFGPEETFPLVRLQDVRA